MHLYTEAATRGVLCKNVFLEGKLLCRSLFLIKLLAEGLQLY